jgi:hypothetical protein
MVPQASLDDCLDRLNKELLQIQSLDAKIAGMVPSTLLDMANQEIGSLTDRLEAAGLECGRLRQLVKDMVPKERLEERSLASKTSQGNRERSAMQYDQAARDELRRNLDELGQLRSEVVRQQKLMEGMVSKTRLIAADEEIADLKAELDRRRTLQKDMVQKSELDKCTEDLQASMTMMMQTQLSQMKSKYDEQIENLRSLLAQMVPKADLSRCEEQKKLFEIERDELKMLMQDMVPRAQMEAAQEAIASLKSEAKRLQKSNIHSC